MKRLEGKAVLVTGAASGIGAATVRRLAEDGALVAAADVNLAAAEMVLAEAGLTARGFAAALDVTDAAAAQAFVAEAKRRLGGLHGLVNCAGIRGIGNVLDQDMDDWHKVLAVNLEGTVNMCQAFARAVKDEPYPGLREYRSIVNISSGAGLMGVPNRMSYTASKFAISGITRSMGAELGPHKVRVNAVAPGMTRTPFTAYMFQTEENIARIRKAHPIGREAEPEEIAAVIVFLLTDDASFMTGAVVPVDGGSTAVIPSH